ncbi:HEPN domain-containing protein [Methylosinus sp. Ce-a6]|uniref:HEPN domain-containing protein n=1 Tax=Methylosinus sp. Ce-a6 TaxID=2172005 RepID=UPI001356F568|nr:HEPN domain-containing protein [Methylosinus sp. Ce-a6]
MKAEAADFLDKAREDLSDARKIASIGLAKVAARCAYYAAFHAAEAFIVESTGAIHRSHNSFADRAVTPGDPERRLFIPPNAAAPPPRRRGRAPARRG